MSLRGLDADLAVRADGPTPVFARPAELVDVSERLFRRIFAAGLWVAAVLSAFAAATSLLHPTAQDQLRGVIVCTGYTALCVGAAAFPGPAYEALRRYPWLLLVAAMLLGAGAWWAGPNNFQLFLPIIAVLGVPGIATPRRIVALGGVIAAAGLAAPHLAHGDGNLGGPIAVLVPPLLFWLIVDRIAGFALRLHGALGPHAAPSGADADADEPDETPSPPPDEADPRELPAPRVIDVDAVRLTSRQLQVILLACEGLRAAEIGSCLGISPTLVRRHLHNARQRTGSATTPQLVAWAQRAGLVPGAT